MDRVFEPFFRIDPARKQSIPGAGLGLAIAKEIIGRYDGEIILTNRATGAYDRKSGFRTTFHSPQRSRES